MKTDVLIIGSGCSGLYSALNLPSGISITIITKSDSESSDSFLAQGGISMLKSEDDFDSYFRDTLKAGHYENDWGSVNIMIRSSQDVIRDLIYYGVDFQRSPDGDLEFTREGAHSDKRILYHEDITGKEITGKLLDRVRELPNAVIMENTTMVDLIISGTGCRGAVVKLRDGSLELISAKYTILATGGIGGLYKHSTNFRHLTGDALAVALKHGIELRDINYIQIHPTTLYTRDPEDRSFLISESVRGEGAKLYGKDMTRFVDELQPRDVVTKAIYAQMEKDGTEFVWEDLRPIPEQELLSHFPNIVEHCRQAGYDVTKECIPVVPAQHYFMGGIKVDHESRTSVNLLYAVGETACNGVHGRNRLASNSLLESLVFAKRAAYDIGSRLSSGSAVDAPDDSCTDLSAYADEAALEREYHDIVLREIEKADKAN